MIFVLLHTIVLLLCSQALSLQSFGGAFKWMVQNPIEFCLAILITAAVGLLLFAITKKPSCSQIPATLVIELLTLVSYYKYVFRSVPLELSDFTLASQFGEIAKFALPTITFSFVTISSVLIPIVLLFVPLIFRKKKNDNKGTFGLKKRVAVLVVAIILIAEFAAPLSLGKTVTKIGLDCVDQQERSDRMGVGMGLYSSYNIRRSFNTNGDTTDELDPFGIDQYELEQADQTGKKPNIIVILSESFFDVTKMPNITFDSDPIPYFHKLQNECKSGTFFSDNFMGGTGYVEIEMLTGISRMLLREGDSLTSLGDKIKNVPSLVSNLEKVGYHTIAMHSHTNELYDRPINLPNLGFDEVIFSDNFSVEAKKSGFYVSDDAFADEIIYLYEHRNESQPLFLYGISMENHLPYDDKYGDDVEIAVKSELLNEKEVSCMENLVTGLKHADDSLKKLVEYFKSKDEPVVIAYFGDHLPGMVVDNNYVYTKLQCCSAENSADWNTEELKKIHSTEYLIWSNDGSISKEDKDTGSCFLGLEVLKDCHIPLCNFFKYLDSEVASSMLVYRNRLFVDRNGNAFDSVPNEYKEMWDGLQMVVGNLIYK